MFKMMLSAVWKKSEKGKATVSLIWVVQTHVLLDQAQRNSTWCGFLQSASQTTRVNEANEPKKKKEAEIQAQKSKIYLMGCKLEL